MVSVPLGLENYESVDISKLKLVYGVLWKRCLIITSTVITSHGWAGMMELLDDAPHVR